MDPVSRTVVVAVAPMMTIDDDDGDSYGNWKNDFKINQMGYTNIFLGTKSRTWNDVVQSIFISVICFFCRPNVHIILNASCLPVSLNEKLYHRTTLCFLRRQ